MRSPQQAAGSVLIVDDSVVQRRYAAELCRTLGVAQVHEAAEGREALDMLASLAAPPDLLVIDLEMPGMDGVELIEELRRLDIRVPIVLASSRGTAIIESVSAMVGAAGMRVLGGLQKPLTLDSMRAALAECSRLAAKPERRKRVRMPIDAQMLGAAIAQGQIQSHYQPKVDMRTGIVRGVEALARWHHPSLGMVPPDEFIALAEREALILPLTLSAMGQAFAQCAAWNARGLQLSLAVNLSPRLLVQHDIVQDICGLCERSGLNATQVVLEVTESSVVDPTGSAPAALARLRLKGFGLSIDDYGTGFSSMQQLARIPFSELKVDRSFVYGAHRRKSLRVILESALDMARRLELSTVAEGIETLEDWRLVQGFGCNIGQGWLIAKAMPADEILPWMKAHHQRLRELRIPSEPTPCP
jgi:EAL domain-containing protein (putative c-di-GMP-specific phosphodiesterase class I)/FixJ family two-component response regulator